MKVEIRYTFEANEYMRKALAYFHGREGLATRDEIKSWMQQNGEMSIDDLLGDYDLSQTPLEGEES